MSYYIYGEDLIAGCIGPFEHQADAQAHVEFLQERGDADPGIVITAEEYEVLGEIFTITPQQDREWRNQ